MLWVILVLALAGAGYFARRQFLKFDEELRHQAVRDDYYAAAGDYAAVDDDIPEHEEYDEEIHDLIDQGYDMEDEMYLLEDDTANDDY